MSQPLTRREFAGLAATLTLLPLAALAEPAGGPTTGKSSLKVLCVGGHPDDPESGCGGTLLKLKAAGHEVTVCYLTRGEAGIQGKTHAEASAIRTVEAEAGSRCLGARPVFFGQIDGATVFDEAAISRMQALVEAEKPDLVFTHWPLDSHKDHQVAGLVVVQAWIRSSRRFDVYFYEVESGVQSLLFRPTDYVDIVAFADEKRRAVFCHTSQLPEEIYSTGGHTLMESFCGREFGVEKAEAFVRLTGKQCGGLA